MKLIQITEPAEILALRQAYFSFDVPSNIQVMMHAISIDGQTIGWIATEDYNTIGGPHLAVREGYKNRNYLSRVEWLFKNVYFKLMKAQGKEYLVTNCDKADKGTQRFMKALGFTVKNVVMAELKL